MAKHNGKPNKPQRGTGTAKQTSNALSIPETKPQPHTETRTADASTKPSEVKPPMPTVRLGLWGTIKPHLTANRAIVFLTLVLAVIGWIQACIYHSQFTEMRIGQRAWLGVKFQAPVLLPKVNEIVCSGIVINNTGQTPAKNIVATGVTREVPSTDQIDFRYPPDIKQDGPLPNGTPLGLFTRFRIGSMFRDDPLPISGASSFCLMDPTSTLLRQTPLVWTDSMQWRFERGETYIETHAEFRYDDAAGRHHWTRLCDTAMAPGHQPRIDVIRSCVAYNDIDEN